MWTEENLPESMQHKSEEQKKVFLKAANNILDRNPFDEDAATFAGISAVKGLSRPVKKKTIEQKKLPSHIPTRESLLKAAEITEQDVIKAVKLPPFLKKHRLPEGVDRNIIAADFNTLDRLVIYFDTGESITTEPVDIKQTIENHIGGFDPKPEVFVPEPADCPKYPAIAFDPITVDGQTVYKMKVNAP